MHRSTSFAAASALAIALAACGSAEEERSAPAEPVVALDTASAQADRAAPVDDASIAADGDASPAPMPTPSASVTPPPSATATRAATPTSAPTRVAAVAAPAGFTQCSVCHSVKPGENGIGPTLAGVFGRRSASVAGFNYSPAMREAGLTWNQANLNRYLGDPSGVVPGTTMALPGVPANERAAIINYLKSL